MVDTFVAMSGREKDHKTTAFSGDCPGTGWWSKSCLCVFLGLLALWQRGKTGKQNPCQNPGQSSEKVVDTTLRPEKTTYIFFVFGLFSKITLHVFVCDSSGNYMEFLFEVFFKSHVSYRNKFFRNCFIILPSGVYVLWC